MAQSAAAETADSPDVFEAVLYPHRSQGRTGFIVLMLAIVVVSVALGIAFALAGAWPVTGFLGLDILLLFLAFRTCRRDGERAEVVRLDADGLHVRRVEPGGASRSWRFEPYWVRVQMDDPPQPGSRLVLASHGERLTLGTFLTPDERLDVARALQAALRPHKEGPAPG
jgi:uncharacterized membrane protein